MHAWVQRVYLCVYITIDGYYVRSRQEQRRMQAVNLLGDQNDISVKCLL